MHEEILSDDQKKLLPLINKFTDMFGLIGGTAIALHLGHRRSIDFDLATLNDLRSTDIRNLISEEHEIKTTLVDHANELSLVAEDVKMTFIRYPFNIVFNQNFAEIIRMPDIITLASMKAYALGRRAKWKDYVDLYFIFKDFSLSDMVEKTKVTFGNEFNEKLFREQLIYFDDIDHSEKVEYMPGFEVSDQDIKESLTSISLQRQS